jgi:hypothetical protein
MRAKVKAVRALVLRLLPVTVSCNNNRTTDTPLLSVAFITLHKHATRSVLQTAPLQLGPGRCLCMAYY